MFCIYNPLTRQYRVLPPRSKKGDSMGETLKVYMCVTEPGYGLFPSKFLVLVVSLPGEGGTALYSSSTSQWQHVVVVNDKSFTTCWSSQHVGLLRYNKEGRRTELVDSFPQHLLSGSQIVSAYDGEESEDEGYFRYFLDAEGQVDHADPNESVAENPNSHKYPFLVEHCRDSQTPTSIRFWWNIVAIYTSIQYSRQEVLDWLRNIPMRCWFKIDDEIDDWNIEKYYYPKLDPRLGDALVVGDAIYFTIPAWSDPDDKMKPFATHLLRYNLLEHTWDVVEQLLLHRDFIGCELPNLIASHPWCITTSVETSAALASGPQGTMASYVFVEHLPAVHHVR